MRPPPVAPRLGMSSFWIGHNLLALEPYGRRLHLGAFLLKAILGGLEHALIAGNQQRAYDG